MTSRYLRLTRETDSTRESLISGVGILQGSGREEQSEALREAAGESIREGELTQPLKIYSLYKLEC